MDNKGIYELKRHITFEGKEIKEIDLSGLEDLTGKDMRELDTQYRQKQFNPAITKEFDVLYLQMVLARATSKPIELFESLKAKDWTALEVYTRNFLLI